MKDRASESDAERRRRAEQQVEARRAKYLDGADADPARLAHELEVHQVELEMQNEELRAAHAELEASSRRYSELFNFAPIGYVVLDPRGNIRKANLEAARMLGTPRDELVERKFLAFVVPEYRDACAGFITSMLAKVPGGFSTENHEVLVPAPGSPQVWLRLIASVLTESALTSVEPALLVAMHDVSARRRAEDALRLEGERKDDFIAALSHELRNPLATIHTGISLLKHVEPGGTQAQKALSILDRQVGHLVHVVDDLLDVTRIARGKIELQRQRVELCDFVEAAANDQRARFRSDELLLDVEVGPTPLWVDADPTRLLQIIDNLLGNARKFTPKGGRVELTLERKENDAALSVRDSGIGIAPEMVGRLFEPFAQAPQDLARMRGGLGLGLALVKNLTELHGGSVKAASPGPGHGATFTARLPLVQAPPQSVRVRAHSKRVPHRVLLIEDNEDAAGMLRDLLELEGHEVRVACDGPSGIALAREFCPTVVLCDIGLPVMDGYQVARAIRADDTLRSSYLIALSGYARAEDRQRALHEGFDGHLAKPLSLQELENLMQAAPGRTSQEDVRVPA